MYIQITLDNWYIRCDDDDVVQVPIGIHTCVQTLSFPTSPRSRKSVLASKTHERNTEGS